MQNAEAQMIAYHNDETIKSAIMAHLAEHRAADEIIKGTYWENGKGCNKLIDLLQAAR
jgi:hypothetical protein